MKKHPTSNIQYLVLSKAEELIRIFYSNGQTAKRNALNERRHPTRNAN